MATNAGNSTIEEIIRNYALTSSTIDRFLQDEKKEQASQLKLLVLGAGGANFASLEVYIFGEVEWVENCPSKQTYFFENVDNWRPCALSAGMS